MPWSEVLTLLRPLVQALAYTHQARAVHRDVKPANIMFAAPEGLLSPGQDRSESGQGRGLKETGTLKLVDFGLAHWEVGKTLTKASDILGSPSYLSPEQARGQPVDGRSDIFALGLIIFEAITGANPLDKGPLFQTIIELGSDQPLDTRLLHRLNLPQPVTDLIERAIAKNPAERHPTCEAFLSHLDECLGTAIGTTTARLAPRPLGSQPPTRPIIQQENQLDLNDQEQALLQTLFSAHNRIAIEERFFKGLSPSRVLRVRPVDESGVRPYLPAVVKIGPRWLIEQEWRAYQAWVEKILPGIARLEGNPILGEQQGILRYALVGSGIFPVQSLYDYYQQHDTGTIRHLLVSRLFKVLGRQWWKAYRSDFSFYLQADYDSILSVNLLLAYVDTPASATVHRIEPNRLPSSTISTGDYVQIKGFVITEVEVSRQCLTVNLPPTTRGPASIIAQVPFGYRLRLTDVPHIEQYRAGQSIDILSGQVVATRHEMLLEQVKKILPQTLDLTAETLSLSADLSLPNPLLAYQDILRQTRPAHRATIHGDLNLENILIDPETSELSMIDFATVRRGHSLHDLLRLETEVVTKLLPPTLQQVDLPLQTIHAFYHQLHDTTASLDATVVSRPLHRELQKPFTVIGTIRQEAREHLFDRTDWTEYYQGLILYLLGVLKFKSLDEMPVSPSPKQVAFWAAATAVELLEG
jgi:serine/threonine protein kinase